MTSTANITHELAAFLRTRRERLAPGDVRLPARNRRRTPGLRREEVAELAGVSVDYVVRLEQGRGVRPSPEVLDALAQALRLTDDERTYLFDLAQQRPRSQPASDTADAPAARLVHDLSPLPAMLVDHRFDILAWNPEMAGLMVDFGALPGEDRNTMWLCLAHPALRDFYCDRELIIRQGIADLRAAWAARPDDTGIADLVERLKSHSDEFVRLWELRDVEVYGRGEKRLAHPDVGRLTIDFEVLTPLQDQDQRLIVYRAADPVSQVALDTIAQRARRRAAVDTPRPEPDNLQLAGVS